MPGITPPTARRTAPRSSCDRKISGSSDCILQHPVGRLFADHDLGRVGVAEVRVGMIEASAMRSASMPRTRSDGGGDAQCAKRARPGAAVTPIARESHLLTQK